MPDWLDKVIEMMRKRHPAEGVYNYVISRLVRARASRSLSIHAIMMHMVNAPGRVVTVAVTLGHSKLKPSKSQVLNRTPFHLWAIQKMSRLPPRGTVLQRANLRIDATVIVANFEESK